MKIRQADFSLGLGAILLSVVYLYFAAQIPESLLSDEVGASGIPKVLGWSMAAIGLLLCLRSVRPGTESAAAQVNEEPAETAPEPAKKHGHLKALGLLAILSGYVVVAPWLGYPVSTALLVAATARYGGVPFGRNLVVISAAAGLGLWVVFVYVFGIPMPTSRLFGGA